MRRVRNTRRRSRHVRRTRRLRGGLSLFNPLKKLFKKPEVPNTPKLLHSTVNNNGLNVVPVNKVNLGTPNNGVFAKKRTSYINNGIRIVTANNRANAKTAKNKIYINKVSSPRQYGFTTPSHPKFVKYRTITNNMQMRPYKTSYAEIPNNNLKSKAPPETRTVLYTNEDPSAFRSSIQYTTNEDPTNPLDPPPTSKAANIISKYNYNFPMTSNPLPVRRSIKGGKYTQKHRKRNNRK